MQLFVGKSVNMLQRQPSQFAHKYHVCATFETTTSEAPLASLDQKNGY